MKLYVYKLYTIYTCVLHILSTDLYVFPRTRGSRGTPFFQTNDFFLCNFLYKLVYTVNIVNKNLYIQIGTTYKVVYMNL